MRQLLRKINKAITLVELLIAVFLLSAVVLTATSVELAMRRMQTGPTVKVKLLDELVPAVDMIKKDYYRHTGSLINSSVIYEPDTGGRRYLKIRVDSTPPYGQINAGDSWMVYRWNETTSSNLVSKPLEYYDNSSEIATYAKLAEGISYFSVTATNPNEAITINIKKKKDPFAAEHSIANPGMNLTTTIYSRGASQK